MYTDEDRLDPEGRHAWPSFKPDWSPDLLTAVNYVSHFTVIRRSLVDDLGGLRTGYDGSQDYDLLLRATERTERIGHVAKPLYSWRMTERSTATSSDAKPEADDAGRRALADALERRGIDATIRPGYVPTWHDVRYAVTTDPLISAIIPTRDRVELLQQCVQWVRQTAGRHRVELVVVDNDSSCPDTLAYMDELDRAPDAVVVRYPERFNYARQMNLAAAAASGELLLLLNNDARPTTPEWLEILAGQALRPEVGAVGARLLFPDGVPQHEGIALHIGGAVAWNIRAAGLPTLAYNTRNTSAVTGACLMVRRGRVRRRRRPRRAAPGGLQRRRLLPPHRRAGLSHRLHPLGRTGACRERQPRPHAPHGRRAVLPGPLGRAHDRTRPLLRHGPRHGRSHRPVPHLMARARGRMSLARVAVIVAALAAVAVVLGTIGAPIIGQGSFHGASLVYAQYPWREDRPVGFTLDIGPIGDTVDSTMPNRYQFGERARDGELALWNPYAAGGLPLGSTSQSGVMSPMNLPFVVLPAWAAPAYAKLIELAVAGGFMYLFVRRLGTSRIPALIAGTAYMTAGFSVAWTNWQHPQVAALIPALFWAVERHLQERRISSIVPIALAVAAMFVGGFPAVAMLAIALLVPYVGVRVLEGSLESWKPDRWRAVGRAFAGGIRSGVGILLGVGLAAAVVLPFNSYLGTLALWWRQQNPENHLDISALATTVVPNALGSPVYDLHLGPTNTVEALSFLGAVIVVLTATALLLRPPERTPRGVRSFLGLSMLVTVILTYVGGPMLEIAQEAPVFDTNFVGRLRVLLGFQAAVLAGLGAQAAYERRLPLTRRTWLLGGAAVLVLVGFLAAAFLEVNDIAALAGERWFVARQAIVPLLAGVGAVAVVVWLVGPWRPTSGARRQVLVASLAVLFAVEALMLVVPKFPRIDEDEFYPDTPVHEFLADHIGNERFASAEFAMLPNSNAIYGLRSVTGHGHHQPPWAALIRTADPQAFSRSPTFSVLAPDPALLHSPILDRMATRYFVTSPGQGIPGEVTPPPPADGTIDIGGGASASADSRPVRGVSVTLAEPLPGDTQLTELAVEITGPDGSVATGSRRIFEPVEATSITVAVPGEDLPATGEMTVTVQGTSGPDGIEVAATGDEPSLGFIEAPEDDGLELVFADGAIVYERTTALPRVRWASEAVVEAAPPDRLALLAEGLPADTVVLNEEPETVTASGADAGRRGAPRRPRIARGHRRRGGRRVVGPGRPQAPQLGGRARRRGGAARGGRPRHGGRRGARGRAPGRGALRTRGPGPRHRHQRGHRSPPHRAGGRARGAPPATAGRRPAQPLNKNRF